MSNTEYRTITAAVTGYEYRRLSSPSAMGGGGGHMNIGPPVSWSRSWSSATSIGALPPAAVAVVVVRLLLPRCGDRCGCCCEDGGDGDGGCGCGGDDDDDGDGGDCNGPLPGEQSDKLSGKSFSVSGSTCAVRRMPTILVLVW